MIESPFIYEESLTPEELAKIGQLALRWSHIEHVLGNCLRRLMRMSMDDAILVIFPMNWERVLDLIDKFQKVRRLNRAAREAVAEIKAIMPAVKMVRNTLTHAIMVEDDGGDRVFHLRSKRKELTKEQIFEAEELTNYAAHVALAFRAALGGKGARLPLPERPALPAYILSQFPSLHPAKKAAQPRPPRTSRG